MKAAELLAMYERVADAPAAVGKLRLLVLDLAIRGKLVSQNETDEPAEALLNQIATEKAALPRRSRGKAATVETARFDIPFALPPGWRWSCLHEAGVLSPRNEAADDCLAAFVPMALVSADYGTENEHAVKPWKDIKSGYSHFAEGDVGLAKITPCFENRKSTIFRNLTGGFGSGTTELHVLRPILVDPSYILIFLKSPFFIDGGVPRMTGTAGQKRIPVVYFAKSPFPLPPLAEQHRIVAKVDELMALCDQLEAARKDREAARDRLAAASLARINAPDPDTFQADARFALNVLPAISARPDQVKQLRQTILNLAVRGKLAAQESGESLDSFPAELLETLGEELPSTWGWVKLEHLLAEETRNGYSRKPDDAPDGVPILRISAGTVRRDGIVAEEAHKLISGIDEVTRRQYGIDAGDLLACRFNGNKAFVGRLTLFTDYLKVRPIYPDKLIRVRVNKRLALPAYVRLAADSDLVRAEVERLCATTVGNWGISASNLKAVRIPLPPLAEQRRVVNRVNALMSLCEQLETSLSNGEAARNSLLDALLNDALRSAGGDEVPSPDAFEAIPAKAIRKSPLHTRPSRSC
ncbi:restriction endonuclease subunit S [Gemmatimonas sp.]|uniref:restriction endonuclease subunit S n=1 Tax=Gemmatimonas sp. TaxID=1962908 RepID=UPI0033423726